LVGVQPVIEPVGVTTTPPTNCGLVTYEF